jgi:hypothetical protein
VTEHAFPTRRSFLRRVLDVPTPARYIIIAAAAAVLLLSALLSVHRNLDFAWTSVRLAPAFALTHGYPLFSSPARPPWVMVGYGPFYPVAYLPSTVAGRPGPAVAIATLLAHLYILVPAGLLSALCVRRLRSDAAPARLHWAFLLLLFALVAYASPSLNYVTSNVHVDAPALGLFLFAAFATLRSEHGDGRSARWLLIAGIAAGLSAACKVNLLAAAVGFCAWIFLRVSARAALRFLVAATAAFAVVYALVALRDGFAPVLLNLQLPGRMPWFTYESVDTRTLSGSSYDVADKVRTFLSFIGDYLRDYGIAIVALLLALPVLKRISSTATEMTTFFLFLALVMLFASVASVGKSGGDVNSRALFTLPLALAALVAFATLVQQTSRSALATAYATLAAATFVVALATAAGFLRWSVKGTATMLEAHATVSAEPGRWYFPFDPLAHLLGEGKFRPNMDVVHSYAAAGSPVDREAFRSALPTELQHIAVPPSFASWGIAEIRRLLPEFSRAARELDLEHHNVISR